MVPERKARRNTAPWVSIVYLKTLAYLMSPRKLLEFTWMIYDAYIMHWERTLGSRSSGADLEITLSSTPERLNFMKSNITYSYRLRKRKWNKDYLESSVNS